MSSLFFQAGGDGGEDVAPPPDFTDTPFFLPTTAPGQPTSTPLPTPTPPPPPTPTPEPPTVIEEIADTPPLYLPLVLSVISALGTVSTHVANWRKEKREAAIYKLELEKKRLELEKAKLELEKSKGSKPKTNNDQN